MQSKAKIVVYDYTKNELFNTSFQLSVFIYNQYHNKLSPQAFNTLTYTACKIHTNLIHAFCSHSKKAKNHYYRTARYTSQALYNLLEAIEPICITIENLFNVMEPHFIRICGSHFATKEAN
ncbi:MAG: hypothetical protein ACRDDX_08335 [Cellulosilyticaceae bacterium]